MDRPHRKLSGADLRALAESDIDAAIHEASYRKRAKSVRLHAELCAMRDEARPIDPGWHRPRETEVAAIRTPRDCAQCGRPIAVGDSATVREYGAGGERHREYVCALGCDDRAGYDGRDSESWRTELHDRSPSEVPF